MGEVISMFKVGDRVAAIKPDVKIISRNLIGKVSSIKDPKVNTYPIEVTFLNGEVEYFTIGGQQNIEKPDFMKIVPFKRGI